jgi:hypothetical protein
MAAMVADTWWKVIENKEEIEKDADMGIKKRIVYNCTAKE